MGKESGGNGKANDTPQGGAGRDLTADEVLKKLLSEEVINQLHATKITGPLGYALDDDHPKRDRLLPASAAESSVEYMREVAQAHGIEFFPIPEDSNVPERLLLAGVLRRESKRRIEAAFADAKAAGEYAIRNREPIGICGMADVEVWAPAAAVEYMRTNVPCQHMWLHVYSVRIPHKGCFTLGKSYAYAYARVLTERGVQCKATAMID